ncbi:MAG: hypothetical protein HKL84_06635 [Acidimicrobiaceae bacterium]|nr:hypothetical protein [Acidimicrobiaceae bacterium]
MPPELLSFDGDWQSYEDMIYAAYMETIVNSGLMFRSAPVKSQYRPETKGKGFGFWHAISESSSHQSRSEDERTPDLRRCERIRWIAWAIENAGQLGFLCWENQRYGEARVIIWAEAHDYVVVLAPRNNYYLLKSAYVVDKPHRRQSFRVEYDAYCKLRKG